MWPRTFNLSQSLYYSNKAWLHRALVLSNRLRTTNSNTANCNLEDLANCDQRQSAWTSRKRQSQQV